MNEIILSYLAGIMDADGYFTIKRQTYAVRIIKDCKNPTYCERVGIKQTSPEAIELIHKYFGGYKSLQKPNVKKGKPLHSIELRNRKAHEFVKAISPYLLIKKRQSEILLELRKHMSFQKGNKVKTLHKNPHGYMQERTHYATSDEQLAFRENLMTEVKLLNDSRNDAWHQPKEWK